MIHMYENNIPHHVFAVWGSQNSGKTTLACNMAVMLANSGYMTCLLSANDHGEFQSFFGTAIPKGKGMYSAISSGRSVRESLTEARQNLCILEADTGGDAYDLTNVTSEQVHAIIDELRDQFSFVIIDCTASKDWVFTGVGVLDADKVVCCIPHRVSAATWHIANKQLLEAFASKTIYVDNNTREGGCNMDQLLEGIDLPECAVRIPCVDSAYRYENRSKPLVLQSGRMEKRYRMQVLKLMNILLEIQAREVTEGKKRRQRRKPAKSDRFGDAERERINADEDDSRRIHKTTGLSFDKKSGRSQSRDDDDAIRRLQESRRR